MKPIVSYFTTLIREIQIFPQKISRSFLTQKHTQSKLPRCVLWFWFSNYLIYYLADFAAAAATAKSVVVEPSANVQYPFPAASNL